MEIVAGLLAIGLVFGLPIYSFIRTIVMRAELEALRHRVQALEAASAVTTAAAAAPRPSTPSPPPLPVAPRPAPAVAASPATAPPDATEELEGAIGGRLLLYAGMVVLLLGVAFFLRYAFEQQWLSPPVRIALGMGTGLGLILGGQRVAQTYRSYGPFLSGGGLAMLYLSGYAALNLYALVSAPIAFGFLVLVSVAAAAMADRTVSLPLALVAVCGGFATPFLVGGAQDAQVTLFSYDALLIAATLYLARRNDWPWLNVLSLALTFVTVAGWADAFYTPDKYLRTELFLTLYCAMFLSALHDSRRSGAGHAPVVTPLLCVAPAAYHLASIAILLTHGLAFAIYVVAFSVAVVIASVHDGKPVLRLAGWIAVALPLVPWLDMQQPAWIVATVLTVVAVHVVHLLPQLWRLREDGALAAADIALLHANGIGLFAAVYVALFEIAGPAQLAGAALLCAAANAGIAWYASRVHVHAALQWVGVAFSLIAMAVAIRADGPWGVVMWAAEGAVAVWTGRRTGRAWLRVGGVALFVVAAARWLQPDIQPTFPGHTVLLNARALSGFFVVALLYAVAWIERDEVDHVERLERAILVVSAQVLTVFIVSKEIVSFWTTRVPDGSQVTFAREAMLSSAWAIYAAALVAIGIRRRYAPIRYFAIALFGLTLLKVFTVDLGTLAGIYRVAGFVLVGVVLLGVSFLYQRRAKA